MDQKTVDELSQFLQGGRSKVKESLDMGKDYQVMPAKPVSQEITCDLVVLLGQGQTINTSQSFFLQ